MICAAIEKGIPVIIGTAGGSSADAHLDWNVDIIREIASEQKISFKTAIIHSEIDKGTMLKMLGKAGFRPGTCPRTDGAGYWGRSKNRGADGH